LLIFNYVRDFEAEKEHIDRTRRILRRRKKKKKKKTTRKNI